MRFELADEAATLDFAGRVAAILGNGGLVFLRGNLGAGKTTFVRGCLRAMGHAGPVKSPTFTLVEEYELAGRKIFHFDLYRLNDPEELEWMGMRDYLGNAALCFVEWPERGTGWMPAPDLEINLFPAGSGRIADLDAGTERGRALLDSFGSR